MERGPNIDYLFTLQQMSDDFSKENRNHYHLDSDRHENDSEHTLSVVLLSWCLYEQVQPRLDLSRVLRLAVAHDLVEVKATDVNTFSSEAERAQKEIDEADALLEMTAEHAAFPDLVQTMQTYQAKADEESVFVWTADKMQALLLGHLDNWRPYREQQISYEWFSSKYDELLKQSSPYLYIVFAGLIDFSKSVYPQELRQG